MMVENSWGHRATRQTHINMAGWIVVCFLVCCAGLVSASPTYSGAACGYQSCSPVKDGMINVHLVPHTHDDVGWLKTVDQYFYGARNDIQNAGVQYVLDSVIPELVKDPSKRFIYVEIAFFSRWWNQQSDSMRHTVKGLVNNGQLEFILGGWCMNDEASTHYNAIIDQHALGFEFLRQNFGDCGRPRVAWQIDPFGHSRELASLFAQMGFDGLFFGRLDYQDKDKRLKDKTMEMVWHASPKNLGAKADLFTGALYNGYGPPGGFCFDQFCDDQPIMDDHRLHDYNVEQKIADFVKAVNDQAQHFQTDHIVMTMGSDFQYQNAEHWYKNMDKLIMYTNRLQTTNSSKINVLYSTPSCYLYQLNKAGKTWPTKSDDFFPYAHRNHSFWTGYFTSRSALKGYVRQTNTFLQACKQLDAMAKLEDSDNSTYNIQVLKEAMGVAQHHDAVSGTEKQHVAYDYAMRLSHGRDECQKVMTDAFNRLIPKGSEALPTQVWCNLLNISYCQFTEVNKRFVMTVYNPLAHELTSWVRLPVIGKAYLVTGPNGETLPTQIVPVTSRTMQIPERKGSMAVNDLVFQVSLPALGISTYFISMTNDKDEKMKQRSEPVPVSQNEEVVMKNEHLALSFDPVSGMLKSIKNLETGVESDINQDIVYYLGHPGNCSEDPFQPSGAYIFRPTKQTTEAWPGPSSSTTISGHLVQETYQTFSPWVTQVTRLYKGEKYAELEWTIGPIPITDNMGKEVVARFMTDLKSDELFYTDANGREILDRKRNYRATWDLNQTEPVAGNYYPINSRIYLQDQASKQQLTVLTDRSLGGGSIKDGQIEIMLHRRLLYDDCLGVGEPLNETGSDGQGLIVRGKLFIYMDTIENSASFHRDMALKTYMAPIPSFAASDMKQAEYSQYFKTMWSGVTQALPPNVHLLTLEQWGGPTIEPSPVQPYLLRLEHFYEQGEDATMSQPATVSLQNLFSSFTIDTVTELTLGANLALADLHRLNWNTRDHETIYKRSVDSDDIESMDVTLQPMEIRTFQITLKDSRVHSRANKFTLFS